MAAAALSQQDATLANLRNRTTGLLTAAALVTSFASGLGLIHTDPSQGQLFPHSVACVLLGLLAAIGGLSGYVLWPAKSFAFGPDAGRMLEMQEAGNTLHEIYSSIAKLMVACRTENRPKIHSRMRSFEAAMVLIVAEVFVLVIALSFK